MPIMNIMLVNSWSPTLRPHTRTSEGIRYQSVDHFSPSPVTLDPMLGADTALATGDGRPGEVRETHAPSLARSAQESAQRSAALHLPAMVAEMARADLTVIEHRGEPIEVRGPGGFKERVRSLEELEEVNAFYGSGRLGNLPQPDLARRLKKMNQGGVRFFQNRRQLRPIDVYRILETEQSPRLVLKWDDHVASCSTEDQVAFVGYLKGSVEVEELEKPDRAKALTLAIEKKVVSPRQAPTLYAQPHVKGLPFQNQAGLRIQPEEFEEPERLQAKLDRFEEVKDYTDEPDMRTLLASGRAGPNPDLLKLAQELHDHYPERAEEYYLQLSGVTRPEEREVLTRLLPHCQDLKEAERLVAHLRKSRQDIEKVPDLLDRLGSNKSRVSAFIEAGPEPVMDWLGEVFGRRGYQERGGKELYHLGKTLDPKERQHLLEIYDKTKGSFIPFIDFLKPRDRQPFRDRLDRFELLSETYDGDSAAALATDRLWPREANQKVAALALFAAQGVGGQFSKVADVLDSLASMEEPECTLRLFAVTKDLEKAEENVRQLLDWEGPAQKVPMAERVEFLAHLIEEHGRGRSSEALSDIRFVASLHEQTHHFSDSARTYLELLKSQGQREARRFYRYTATSPLPREVIGDCQSLADGTDSLRVLLKTCETTDEKGWQTLKKVKKAFARQPESPGALFVARALLESPSSQNLELLGQISIDDMNPDVGLRFAETVLKSGADAGQLERFARLNAHGWEGSLTLWPLVRDWDPGAFLNLDRILSDRAALTAEQARAVAQALMVRREGEQLEDIVRVSAKMGRQFGAWRQVHDSLDQGPEMTALEAAFLGVGRRHGREVLDLVETPVAAESKAVRAQALAELVKGGGSDRVSAVWSKLAEILEPEDEDLLGYCRLGALLQKHGYAGFDVAVELATRKKRGIHYNFERIQGVAQALVTSGEALSPEALVERLMKTEAEIEFDTDMLHVGDYSLPFGDS